MADAKAIRKQVRNVMQEVLPEVMKDVITESLTTQLKETLLNAVNSRCDSINAFCKTELTRQDKRARDVQGYLIGQVKNEIQRSMGDMDVTIEAVISVLAESGVVVDDFINKVNAKKPEVLAQREAEAKANMEAELEKRRQESASEEQAQA